MEQPRLALFREVLPSPVGDIVLLTDGQGRVRALDFHDYDARMRRLLDRHYGAAGWSLTEAHAATPAAGALGRYLAGDLAALVGVETATNGTAFQREVWAALRQVPAAASRAYGELAHALGRPGSARAVGRANGSNPIAIVVPCHRVVGAGGALTGYAGGVERKRWLLEHERRHAG